MNAIILVFLLLLTETRAACLSGTLTLDLNTVDFDLRRAEDVALEFEEAVRSELPKQTSLVINLEALNPRINAEITRQGENIVIDVMGGMLAHPEMKPDTLKLLLCHELGHLLGGPPLKSRNGWSSTEGQADYFSAKICARNLRIDEVTFTEAAIALTTIYAEVTMEPRPRLEQCDERIVERTNYGYPPVQCRLDTLLSGWRGGERPACWFRP